MNTNLGHGIIWELCFCRFLQTVDQKVAELREVISSKQQGQPQEVIDRLSAALSSL